MNLVFNEREKCGSCPIRHRAIFAHQQVHGARSHRRGPQARRGPRHPPLPPVDEGELDGTALDGALSLEALVADISAEVAVLRERELQAVGEAQFF